MPLKRALRALARWPGYPLYSASAPVWRLVSRSRIGRAGLEAAMRGGGRAIYWAFEGRRHSDPQVVRSEWERILRGLGIAPEPAGGDPGGDCATCFSRCSLRLKPGDSLTCDTVMSLNDELIHLLGGRMTIVERLTDAGSARCVVRIAPRPLTALPGERELWFEETRGQRQFDRVAGFYDSIMGRFEKRTNRRALGHLPLAGAGAVLDLGAGTGLGLLEILRRVPAGTRVIAVDSSSGMLEQCRLRVEKNGFSDRVAFVRADAAHTGLPPCSQDAVYSSFLLDLLDVPKRRAVLGEVRRILKPPGFACFAVMEGEAETRRDRFLASLYSAAYRRWNPLWKVLFAGYAPHCRPIRLLELLQSEGFSVVRRDRAYAAIFPIAIYLVRRVPEGVEAPWISSRSASLSS